MGLIRKSLAIGTVGVVSPSSKKQKVAKATQRAAQANARVAAQLVAQQAEANRLARQKAHEEHEFRYETDAVYRKYVDDKRAAEEAARHAESGRIAEIVRVRRERRQQRTVALARGTIRTVAILGAAAAIPLAAVFVWLPQFVIARTQHGSMRPWLGESLTRPFRRARSS